MKQIIFYLVFFILSSCHKCCAQTITNNSSGIIAVKDCYFLFFSDIHLDISQEITDSTTDTGLDLWSIFKVKIDSILGSPNPPSFVICGGDLPAHYKCDTSCNLTGSKLQKHNQELSIVFTAFRNLSAKYKIPFYYVPGNNDPLSGDYFSFANINGQTPFSLVPDSVNPYPALNMQMPALNGPHIISMPHPSMGYYSATIFSGLRIIALNSIIFGNNYEPVDGVSQIDAGNDEMQWLSGQLQEAANQKQKVYIAMHIPPGIDAYKFSHHKMPNTTWAVLPSAKNSWLNFFLNLADTYQNTIEGIFYSHTHMDELRLLYDSTGKNITAIAISAPGISPQHGNNPGFKTVSFNPATIAITDFTTFYTKLPVKEKWGSYKYRFSDIFKNTPGTAIKDFIKTQNFDLIANQMNQIYTVMNGNPKYVTKDGISVKSKQ